MAGEPYIRFDRVEVAYSDLVSGLRGASFSIEKGEFVFFVGQTGSGKSTLLKVISRQVAHTSGRASLAGRDLAAVSRDEIPHLRRQMGIVPQDFGLLPNKNVWENVGYALRASGRTRRDVRKTVPGILERVNILHRADAFPRELSQGEQQRVAIGRALIHNPPLLLAAELTANLDPSHTREIMDLLLELNLRGTTILVATHDMAAVEYARQRVVSLEFGSIVADDPALGRAEPSVD
jgi:cell division transport system ATP-binding protein